MLKNLALITIILAACTNTFKADYEVQAELRMIDTLNTRLAILRGWMDKMPLNELYERIEIIGHNEEFCAIQLKEKGLEMNEETARLMEEYHHYGELYKKAAFSYTSLVTGFEESFIALKTLKESAHGKDYRKEIFLTYFESEKMTALNLYDVGEQTLKPAIDTDLAFQRAQGKVEELAESLKN